MKRLFLIMILMWMTLQSAVSQNIPQWKMADLEAYMNRQNREVLVINFWATFCKPCVAEIPHFISICREYEKDNVKLLLVSLDMKDQYPKKIRSFARKHGFNTSISWLNETNADYFCPRVDTRWTGSIPATLILNRRTGYRYFYEGELDADAFRQALDKAIRWVP